MDQKNKEFEKFKARAFDLQDDKKKILNQNKELKAEIEKLR
jgi:hypothetical protein